MTGIQAVVFDIGNVLIEWQPERFFDGEIGREARERMFAEVDLHVMNDRVDLGHPFSATVGEWADRHPAWREAIRIWHDRWIEMASPEIPRSVALLRALRARDVPVLALSNFGVETFARARAVYPFLDEFDRRWLSGEMGIAKPDPAIYARLEDESGIAPAGLLFADDRADNIAAAAARGWRTHLFTDPEGWQARLVAEGLLEEREVP